MKQKLNAILLLLSLSFAAAQDQTVGTGYSFAGCHAREAYYDFKDWLGDNNRDYYCIRTKDGDYTLKVHEAQ